MKSTLVTALGLAVSAVNAQSYVYSESAPYGVEPTPSPSNPVDTSYGAGPTLTSSYSLTAYPYPTVVPHSSSSSVSGYESQSTLPVQPTSSSQYVPPGYSTAAPESSSSSSSSPTSSSTSEWHPPPYGSVTPSIPIVSSSAQATYGTSLPPVSYSTTITSTSTSTSSINCAHSSYAWNTTTTAVSSAASGVTGGTTDCPPTFVTSTAHPTTIPPYGGGNGGNNGGYGGGNGGNGGATSASSPVISGQAPAADHRSSMAALLMALAFGAAFVL